MTTRNKKGPTGNGPRSKGAQLDVELINVGHGDSILLKWTAENGVVSTILIDGGPIAGADRIAETLRKVGAEKIDLAVLTHCDADHVDGLVRYADREDRLPIEKYWGPCVPAFQRHSWLFPDRIKRGLDQTEKLQKALEKDTTISWPVEGAEWTSLDGDLTVRVLSPAGRLLERLLIGDDALELFMEAPTPLGFLLRPALPPPIEDRFGEVRGAIASGEINPDRIRHLPASVSDAMTLEHLKPEARAAGVDPEFFGNNVLNDTSIVLLVDARIGAVRRRLLFTGDLENFLYLQARHPLGLHCDVVKAPHHGSRSYVGRDQAYDAVWQWLRPRAVLVSANGKHKLPRQEFRDAVLRHGGMLFCTCRRSKEIVMGVASTESCHERFGCGTQAPVSLTLDASSITSQGIACGSGIHSTVIPVIQMRQHVVEPSSILQSFGEGELRRHGQIAANRLAKIHSERLQTLSEPRKNGVGSALLAGEAAADGRFRASSNIDAVLNWAALDGRIWLTPGTIRDERAAWILPTKTEWIALHEWLENFSIIQLGVVSLPKGLTSAEILSRVTTNALATEASLKFGFPEAMFAKAIWPRLSASLSSRWTVVMREPGGTPAAIVLMFKEDSIGAARTALRDRLASLAAGQSLSQYLTRIRSYLSTASQTASAPEWPSVLQGVVPQLWSTAPSTFNAAVRAGRPALYDTSTLTGVIPAEHIMDFSKSSASVPGSGLATPETAIECFAAFMVAGFGD